MGGIRVLMLRRDFTVAKKKINSNASHAHYGNGSYMNMESGILTTQNPKDPPVLIFQEGNAIPKGVPPIAKVPTEGKNQPRERGPMENVKWGTWYIPMLRGLNRQRHGRGNLTAIFKTLFNLKTLPFWVIGLAVLSQFIEDIIP